MNQVENVKLNQIKEELFYSLDHAIGGVDALAEEWKARIGATDIPNPIKISLLIHISPFGEIDNFSEN